MVKNELLKMKKVKKEKSKKILTEITEPSNETVQPLKTEEALTKTPNKEKKKKKRKSEDDPTAEVTTSPAKKAKEVTKEPATDITEAKKAKDVTKEPAGKQSNIRTVKKRLESDCDYIVGLMASFHIPPQLREGDEDSEDDEMYVKEGDRKKMKKEQAENRAANQEELQERLKAKLDELKGKKVVGSEANQKKKMKKQLAMIEKKKALKDENKLKQKLMKIGGQNAGGGGNKVKMEALDAAGGKAVKPVKTSSGKVVFSKFDFTEEAAVAEKKHDIDPKAALKQIEKKKEKIKVLEDRGKTEKIKVLEDKAAWATAMDRAEGTIIKDDVTLLKKSIKKMDQRKKSSKNKWEDRKDQTEKRIEGKQSKRTDNLQKRKKEKKEKKMGKRG